MFSIVQKPNYYVFCGQLAPPQSLGEGLQVSNFEHCLHIVMVIGTCTDDFRGTFHVKGGSREAIMREDRSMEEFITRDGNFHEGAAGFFNIILKSNEKTNK